ncbi:MAG TPA: hypothetical protein VEY12_02565 [Thermoplasmata archaeon]|nr:hypothetical protein [Thermoplasmata archaeon]
MEKRLAYSYGRALVLSRLALFAIAFVLVGGLLAFAPRFPLLPAALFLGLLAFALLLFAVSPLLTQHWLTRSRLILRQGWYFRIILPFSEIVTIVAPDETAPLRVPLGIHRPLGQTTLYVTGGKAGLLLARLDRPRRFWSSFGLAATQIVFDVDDREGFLRAYGERRSLLPPVQPDRADAELRD